MTRYIYDTWLITKKVNFSYIESLKNTSVGYFTDEVFQFAKPQEKTLSTPPNK